MTLSAPIVVVAGGGAAGDDAPAFFSSCVSRRANHIYAHTAHTAQSAVDAKQSHTQLAAKLPLSDAIVTEGSLQQLAEAIRARAR